MFPSLSQHRTLQARYSRKVSSRKPFHYLLGKLFMLRYPVITAEKITLQSKLDSIRACICLISSRHTLTQWQRSRALVTLICIKRLVERAIPMDTCRLLVFTNSVAG